MSTVAEKPAVWTMPRPMYPMVLWRHHQPGTRLQMAECPAIVTRIYESMLDLMIFPSQTHLPQPKSGVKFHTDPSLQKMSEPNSGGVWDFTEAEKELISLRREFMEATVPANDE